MRVIRWFTPHTLVLDYWWFQQVAMFRELGCPVWWLLLPHGIVRWLLAK